MGNFLTVKRQFSGGSAVNQSPANSDLPNHCPPAPENELLTSNKPLHVSLESQPTPDLATKIQSQEWPKGTVSATFI